MTPVDKATTQSTTTITGETGRSNNHAKKKRHRLSAVHRRSFNHHSCLPSPRRFGQVRSDQARFLPRVLVIIRLNAFARVRSSHVPSGWRAQPAFEHSCLQIKPALSNRWISSPFDPNKNPSTFLNLGSFFVRLSLSHTCSPSQYLTSGTFWRCKRNPPPSSTR